MILADAAARPTDLARERQGREAFHRERARKLLPWLIAANLSPPLGVALGVLLAFATANLAAVMFTATAVWWIPGKVRKRRAGHLLKAAAFAQPFAEEVIGEARRRSGFVLFLRAFDPEREMTRYRGPNAELGSPETGPAARPIEALLVDLTPPEVPILALPDPRVGEPLPGAYRFHSISGEWQAFVRTLIGEARMVVLHLTSLSPGVRTEIELLRSAEAERRTLVVVANGLRAESAPDAEAARAALAAFPYVVRERVPTLRTRRAERGLRAAVLEGLRAMSPTDREGRPLLRTDGADAPLFTPAFPVRVWHFLRGPALWAAMLLGIFFLLEVHAVLAGHAEPGKAARESFLALYIGYPALAGLLVLAKFFYLTGRELARSGEEHAERLARLRRRPRASQLRV